MKIELEIPYIEDDELSIKIIIRKDGVVSVEGATSAPNVIEKKPKTQPKEKKKSSATAPPAIPNSFGGNFMNAEF